MPSFTPWSLHFKFLFIYIWKLHLGLFPSLRCYILSVRYFTHIQFITQDTALSVRTWVCAGWPGFDTRYKNSSPPLQTNIRLVLNLYIYRIKYAVKQTRNFFTRILECTTICPSTPIFGKLGLKFGNHFQFKCDLEHNTFWNVIHASKVNLWMYMEMVNTIRRHSKMYILIFVHKWRKNTPMLRRRSGMKG
jgi:hypothetical protein